MLEDEEDTYLNTVLEQMLKDAQQCKSATAQTVKTHSDVVSKLNLSWSSTLPPKEVRDSIWFHVVENVDISTCS